MAKSSIRLVGVPKVQKTFTAMQVAAKPLATAAMKVCVQQIQRDSMKMTPIDTGNLRASHDATVVSRGAFTVMGMVFVTAGYAIYVHENLEARHEVGEAKFLEKAMRMNREFVFDTFRTFFRKI